MLYEVITSYDLSHIDDITRKPGGAAPERELGELSHPVVSDLLEPAAVVVAKCLAPEQVVHDGGGLDQHLDHLALIFRQLAQVRRKREFSVV